ncbi:MAG: esterase-like activity of phytase family protein [Desulfobulbaceae bacterium]|nr:esterase-like activity of phytase family protein [Desulfobulbaceae bacterium]
MSGIAKDSPEAAVWRNSPNNYRGIVIMNLWSRLWICTLICVLQSCSGGVSNNGSQAPVTSPASISISSNYDKDVGGSPGSTINFKISAANYATIGCDFEGTGTYVPVTPSSDIKSLTPNNKPVTDVPHTYANSGEFTATCQATNTAGRITTSNAIPISIVNPLPSISISSNYNAATGERPGSTIIFDIAATNYAAIKCDFEGSGTFSAIKSTGQTPYTYEKAGDFVASCQATSPKGFVTISNAVPISISYLIGDVIKQLPIPTGVSGVADLVYDKASDSLWLLGDSALLPSTKFLININKNSGEVITKITSIDLPDFLNWSSEMALADRYFYFTSYGWSNGIPQSVIYKTDMAFKLLGTYPCPATNAGGFCEGLAWDGQYLWSAGSDSKRIVRFTTDGLLKDDLGSVLGMIKIDDLDFDQPKHRLIAINTNKDRYFANVENDTITINDTRNIPLNGRGGWDGMFWWEADNQNMKINQIYIGK